MTPARTGPPRATALLAMLAAVLAGAAGLLAAAPASAHTSLVSSSPESGATLTAAPPEVRLVFSEDISSQIVTVEVVGPDGESFAEGEPSVDGALVTQDLAQALGGGEYEVTFRVVSGDGHPVADSFTFEIVLPGTDEGDVEPPATAAPEDPIEPTTDATVPTSDGTSPPADSPTSEESPETETSTSVDDTAAQTPPETTSPEATSTAPDEEGDGGSALWIFLAALAVLLIGGLVILLNRRGGDEEDVTPES